MRTLQSLHVSAILLFLYSFTFVDSAAAQQFKPEHLALSIHQAIEKAYPASVRIWGFDTLTNTRTGAQFTGVVVSAEGHILTAAHVNTPGNTYRIMFPDGKNCIAVGSGEIELADAPTTPDVAMMKIVGNGIWPFAEIGSSSSLVKNAACISIAYPESQDQPLPMVRFGRIQDLSNKYGFIQSTCIMEPGDSGGPLFDDSGRVIGLHSAVDVAEDDNFEVPVDLYRKYWSALNKAVTYTSFPPIDALLPAVNESTPAAIPALENLDATFKVDPMLNQTCMLITSNIAGKEQKIQGSLFSLSGIATKSKSKNNSMLISKSSLVGQDPFVELAGKRITTKIVARDKENDLVLLALGSNINGGIQLKKLNSDTVKFNQLGEFLVSPLAGGGCRISVLGSTQFSLPKITSIGYLGVQVAYFGPLVITTTQPDTPANEFKLEKGDELLRMNGVTLNKRADFIKESKKYWAGDKITIQVKRGDSTFEKEVVLIDKPQTVSNHPAGLFTGGKSVRRDGFNKVFAHDAKLMPFQCGGPVFNADGHFHGINIARFSRTSSLVIPAAVVLDFIASCQLMM